MHGPSKSIIWILWLVVCMAIPLAAQQAGAPSAARQAAPLSPGSSWLDQPMTGWNAPGRVLPRPPQPPPSNESRADTMKRCSLTLLTTTAAERGLADAGWIPFHNFDQQLLREDVEIVGGMSAADGMCRPVAYNLFAFVGGVFAGTLSPVLMTSRLDSSSGAVRIPGKDSITADYSRYTNTDALCCPSSHVVVRYRIDRSAAGAFVIPVEARARP